MFIQDKLYSLTSKSGSICTANRRCDGPVAMTKEQIVTRIGDNDPSEFRIFELVPIERQFALKMEIV